MANLVIRAGTDLDQKALEEVDASARVTLRSFYKLKPAADQERSEVPPTKLIVAEIDSRIVGCCEFYIRDIRLCFMALGVHQDFRRRGVFRRFFEYLEQEGRRMGCEKITCWTVEGTGTQEVFQKVGMVVKHRELSKLFEAPDGRPVFELYLERQL